MPVERVTLPPMPGRGAGSNAASAPHSVAALLLILRATRGVPQPTAAGWAQGRPQSARSVARSHGDAIDQNAF